LLVRREEGYPREAHGQRLALKVLSVFPTVMYKPNTGELTGIDAKVDAVYRQDSEPDGQNVVLKLW